jgi:oligopeptide transport system permease protein
MTTWLVRFPWLALGKQLATFLLVIWIISTATFFLARAIPGGPFTQERALPEHIEEQLLKQYQLDQPLFQQYLSFLGRLVQFDLGDSYYDVGRTVNQNIIAGFPKSAALGLIALLLAIAVGVPVGIISALWQNRWPDYTALFIAILGVSVPSFILASLLQYVFSYKMNGFLPASGLESGWGFFRSAIMPSLAMSSFALAFIIRLVRSEMIDILSREFIMAARMRGASMWRVTLKHALRNALLPVVTYLGPLIAALFTGSFVIESIFDIPGLGRYFVESISNRDYNMILGVTIFYSTLLVFVNMSIDFLYRFIDPRVTDATSGAD